MKKMYKLIIVAALVCCGIFQTTTGFSQAPGSLDLTFGGTGYFTTAVSTADNAAWAVAIQPADQKIVVAGYANNGANDDFAVVRYNTDGSPDNTFGTGGRVITPVGNGDDRAFAVIILSGGKILAGGYTTTGSYDDFAMVCYNTNGTLNTSFGTGGMVISSVGNWSDRIWSLGVQTDGKIIAGGSTNNAQWYPSFALARYSSGGVPDNSYGSNGVAVLSFGASVATQCGAILVQPDNKTVVTGYIGGFSGGPYEKFALARFTDAGVLDNTFGTGGKISLSVSSYGFDFGYAAALAPDGSIFQAGSVSQTGVSMIGFGIVKFNSSGVPDNSFGVGGKVVTAFGGINTTATGYGTGIQTNGKIIVAGNSDAATGTGEDFALARYNTNGALDNTFGSGGKVTTAIGDTTDYGRAMAVQADGNIVVVGSSFNGTHADFALARYIGDATVGISDMMNFENFSLSPNPAIDEITLTVPGLKTASDMRIFNIQGQLLYKTILQETNNIIDVSFLPAGVYILKVENDKMSETGRFIKENSF